MEEELFNAHLNDGPFQIGVEEDQWAVHEIKWPNVIIWIKAKSIDGAPDRYYFKFELSGYPSTAPTARPWDIAANSPLSVNLWPKGTGNVQFVFNPNWKPDALYAPCDRIAMAGHDSWKTLHKGLWWESTFTITVYLRFLYKLLNSEHYAGC